MKTVDREYQGQREEFWPFEEHREYKPPEIFSAFVDDTKYPERPHESNDMIEAYLIKLDLIMPWFEFFEECLDAFVELLGRIDGIHNLFIAIEKCVKVHLRDKVHRAIRIIAGAFFQQAVLFLHPFVKATAARCIE